jgi:hypothetical protein
VRGTSHPGYSSQKLVDPSGSATSCGHGRHRCRGAARVLSRRGGATSCHDDCRRSRPVDGPRWCSARRVPTQADSSPLMPRPHPPPLGPNAEREAGSGCVRMVLPLVHVPTPGVKRSFPLVVLLLPPAAPSPSNAPASPRRSRPPDSHAATWLQRQGFATPT